MTVRSRRSASSRPLPAGCTRAGRPRSVAGRTSGGRGDTRAASWATACGTGRETPRPTSPGASPHLGGRSSARARCRLHLAKEALGVGLARERLRPLPREQVAVASPVAAISLLDEPHDQPPGGPPGSTRGARGSETRGFLGHRRITARSWRTDQKRSLTCASIRKAAGGGAGNRTRVEGFAGPCLNHSATPPAGSR